MHAHQVSHLESTVTQLRSELREAKRMYEDKVCMDLCVSISGNWISEMLHIYKEILLIRDCFRKSLWTIT